ncbi:MAG TPA: ECF transporter S component [Clostridiales bacterium]|nr:ECF transporter S component [Clostridiales bacterium]
MLSDTTTNHALSKNSTNVRKMAIIAMFAALSAVLMFFEFPIGFLAPSFYELDFSEVPVLIGTFILGPVAGITIELVKILVKLVIKGTSTGGVGELANFLIGCSLIIPASLIYKRKKTRKRALVGIGIGTITMALFGAVLNAVVLLPVYSVAYGAPIDAFVQMGSVINPMINDIFTFCLFAVAPFNIFKGIVVGFITFLLYKPLSSIIHSRVLK